MSHHDSSCPSCGKIFKDHTSVACHMSQPRSGCNMLLEDMINSILPGEDHNMDSADDEDFVGLPRDVSHDPGLGGEEDFYYFGGGGEDIPDGNKVHTGEVIDYFPEPPLAYEDGYTFLGLFDADENSVYQKTNLYYPFSSRRDWQLAAWLLHSGLSMGKIDSFLSLEMIKDLPLSFRSARELRGRAEMLPSVIHTSHPTKSPVILYWRDPIECITSIFNHPLFHHHMDLTPRKIYSTAERLCRVYTGWMSGNDAWDMQSTIPKGATLLGTILSSDKTNITALTGDHIAHLLRISLSNIHMNVCSKSSTNSFILAALLPVPKFIHKKKRMKGVLEDCLIHQCLNIAYFHEARKFRLNGIDKLFWWDYALADPSQFLTPESLHHLHKEFFDHDAQWLICAVGDSEIDFQFSVLQPITGYQHFYGGISKLKQVTGRCEREIQHYIIAISVDAAPPCVIAAVRALMQFWYLIQSPRIDEEDLGHISGALTEFHTNKDAILAAVARRGKGNRHIDNFDIPKLELMQSIIPSICNSGIIRQWSADITEHTHIMEIKDPARSSNNKNYDTQICQHLDRAEKCRRFELATSLLDHGQRGEEEGLDLDAEDSDIEADVDTEDVPIDPTQHPRQTTNYFVIAKALQHQEVGSVPVPPRSFVDKRTAFHLGYDPSIRSITIDEVTIKFGLPDLQPAIADFLQREATYGHQHVHSISGPRRAGSNAVLPFDKEMDFHDTHTIKPAQTLNCVPPNNPWILGRYDTVIVETSAGYPWPSSRLLGHTITQIRLIMRPIGKSGVQWSWKDRFLMYVQCFDFSNDRDPTTRLYALKRAKHSNGNRMGDIILVSQLRAPVQLVPHFGATADKHLSAYNS
ncbi:uncharacterized protein F5147DRAFT_748146 [Suillus discolor]|uniref:DUF6830 domain-containing protein n=1 Tax=Suillus discolor TaxID=1912936 RepID=A0A9P7EV87_9AGAM|nr:uncharacterized protein F5147DRAFT_748146 [Suillus discolor]KAG2091184.1 hypothetical protein F5147DRAFT_748146 [Suillus discolor]